MDLSENNLMAPAQSYLPEISLNKWRAKLYHLNSDGCWDDFGTGTF